MRTVIVTDGSSRWEERMNVLPSRQISCTVPFVRIWQTLRSSLPHLAKRVYRLVSLKLVPAVDARPLKDLKRTAKRMLCSVVVEVNQK